MKLILPPKTIRKLKAELRTAGIREMGGMLMGEHVESETFRIAAISFQRSGGSAVHFVRDPEQHRAFSDKFFAETGHDYERFNYLGEWHSHPCFAALPSERDVLTSQELVEGDDLGVNFLVLLICRLARFGRLEMSVTAFRRGGKPEPVSVELEAEDSDEPQSILRRFLRLFQR